MLAMMMVANLVVLTGGHQLEATGRDVLSKIMVKEIVTIIIAGVYAGLSFGRDFDSRTFSRPIASGSSRAVVLLAKTIVFFVAMDALILAFPVLAVLWCTIINGWGVPFDANEAISFMGVVGALVLLGAAIASVSMLASVFFRSSGPTVGMSVAFALVQMPLLNGAIGQQAAFAFPIGAMVEVSRGSIPSLYGSAIGLLWCAVLIAISYFIIRRAELQ